MPSQAAPMELFSSTLGKGASLTVCLQLSPCRRLPATTEEHAPFQEHAPERGPWIVWRDSASSGMAIGVRMPIHVGMAIHVRMPVHVRGIVVVRMAGHRMHHHAVRQAHHQGVLLGCPDTL